MLTLFYLSFPSPNGRGARGEGAKRGVREAYFPSPNGRGARGENAKLEGAKRGSAGCREKVPEGRNVYR